MRKSLRKQKTMEGEAIVGAKREGVSHHKKENVKRVVNKLITSRRQIGLKALSWNLQT